MGWHQTSHPTPPRSRFLTALAVGTHSTIVESTSASTSKNVISLFPYLIRCRSKIGSLNTCQIFNLSVTMDHSPITQTSAQALWDPHWKESCDAGFVSQPHLGSCSLPSPCQLCWLFHHKFDGNGRLQNYKARLVA